MKRPLHKHSYKHLGLLLGIIALTAGCGNLVFMDDGGLSALHAAKYAKKSLSIEGKVIDQEGTPLEGISVVVIGRYLKDTQIIYGGNYRELDTLATDANGFYRMPERTVTPAFTDLQIDAFDSMGRYKDGSVTVQNVQVGSVAPTLILFKQ